MHKYLLLLFALLGFFYLAYSQKFQKGYYYREDGEKVEGWIKFSRASFSLFGNTPSSIKFKSDIKDKHKEKYTAKNISSFVIGLDSFTVLNNIKVNSINGEYDEDFVRVLITGKLNLYQHFSSSSDGNFRYVYDVFIVTKEGQSPLGLRNLKKQKEELLSFFKDKPDFYNNLIGRKITEEELPDLIVRYNLL